MDISPRYLNPWKAGADPDILGPDDDGRTQLMADARTPEEVAAIVALYGRIEKRKTAEFPHGPSIKWPEVYEALRRQGMDKSQAAAISNAHWNKYRRWGRAGAPGPKSASDYERLRGRKARRRKGIPLPKAKQEIAKMTSIRRRRAQLVARLKARRNYAAPVRGGTGKQRRTRRKKFG